MGTTADQAQFKVFEEADAAETLQGLLDQAAETVGDRQTGVERKAQIAAALESSDIDALLDLQEKLENLIDRILANTLDTSENPGLLSPAELYDYMLEHLQRKDAERLLEVRNKMVKARVFAHLTEQERRKGAADPEHTPSEALVPKLRKRFTREGGKAKVTLDHEKLIEKLTPEQSARVLRTVTIPEQTIPEQTKTTLDEDALLEEVRESPALLDQIRDCIIVGEYGVARFQARDMS